MSGYATAHPSDAAACQSDAPPPTRSFDSDTLMPPPPPFSLSNSIHHHHQVPDLEQTLATMPLQTSLSSDNFKKFKPLLCPPVAELQRLSRNVNSIKMHYSVRLTCTRKHQLKSAFKVSLRSVRARFLFCFQKSECNQSFLANLYKSGDRTLDSCRPCVKTQ